MVSSDYLRGTLQLVEMSETASVDAMHSSLLVLGILIAVIAVPVGL